MAAIFISHSSHDSAAASRVRELLMAEGYAAVFLDFDPEAGIPAGRNWERELYTQLHMADAVVYLHSPAALVSTWCFAELALARSVGIPIVPVQVAAADRHALLGDVQWLEAGGDLAGGLRRALRALALDPARSFSWDPARPPYPGLAAFEPEDAAVFFGREAEVKDLVRRLHPTLQRGADRLVAVVGPSGSGKSSLVRGGLIPQLRKQGGWLVLAPMKPGHDPLRNLARLLARAMHAPERAEELNRALRDRPGTLVQVIDELQDYASASTHSVLLVLDQAEELVTITPAGERKAFIEVLRSTFTSESSVWTIATVRSELLNRVLTVAGLADILRETKLIGPLARAQLFQVVRNPARRAGLELEEGLVARLVDDTVGGDALPLLAYTLQRLWVRQVASGRPALITIEDYEAIGGVVGALREQADAIADELNQRGRGDLVLPTLIHLATVVDDSEPARRRVSLESFGSAEHEVVQAFVEARLLTTHGERDQVTIEVAHEALLRNWPPLRQAIEQARADLRTRSELERLSADWRRSGRRESYRLRGLRLNEAREWASAHASELSPADGISEFLGLSGQWSVRAASPNEHLLERLLRYLDRGSLVVVLGSQINRAGPEANASADPTAPPDYEQLAVALARRFDIDADTLELGVVAQAVETQSGKRALERGVRQILSERHGIGPVPQLLAKLTRTLAERHPQDGFPLIVTANLDASLERAFEAAELPYELVMYGGGHFIHVPWAGHPVAIEVPHQYSAFPVSEYGELLRTVIMKPFASMDNFVITADEVADLLPTATLTHDVPVQILSKLWDSHVLLLGQPARDPTTRPLARLLWRDEEATARSWALARDATSEDKERWHRHGIELVNADPATYIEHIEHQLTRRSLG